MCHIMMKTKPFERQEKKSQNFIVGQKENTMIVQLMRATAGARIARIIRKLSYERTQRTITI